MSEAKDESNYPEPQSIADRLALRAAELLDEDVFDSVSNTVGGGTCFYVRGVFFTRIESPCWEVGTETKHSAKILQNAKISEACTSVLRQAFEGAMRRQTDRDLERVAQKMDPPPPPPVDIPETKLIWRIFGGPDQ